MSRVASMAKRYEWNRTGVTRIRRAAGSSADEEEDDDDDDDDSTDSFRVARSIARDMRCESMKQ